MNDVSRNVLNDGTIEIGYSRKAARWRIAVAVAIVALMLFGLVIQAAALLEQSMFYVALLGPFVYAIGAGYLVYRIATDTKHYVIAVNPKKVIKALDKSVPADKRLNFDVNYDTRHDGYHVLVEFNHEKIALTKPTSETLAKKIKDQIELAVGAKLS